MKLWWGIGTDDTFDAWINYPELRLMIVLLFAFFILLALFLWRFKNK